MPSRIITSKVHVRILNVPPYSKPLEKTLLMSVNCMSINIIIRMRAPYFPYALYRESQAIGRVNWEGVWQSTNQPYEGNSQVSTKPAMVTEPPEILLEWDSWELQQYWHWGRPAVGMKGQLLITEQIVLNMNLKLSLIRYHCQEATVKLLWIPWRCQCFDNAATHSINNVG